MLEWIWGLKTVAMFDVWTFEHILSGVSVGQAVRRDNQRHHLQAIEPITDFSEVFPDLI